MYSVSSPIAGGGGNHLDTFLYVYEYMQKPSKKVFFLQKYHCNVSHLSFFSSHLVQDMYTISDYSTWQLSSYRYPAESVKIAGLLLIHSSVLSLTQETLCSL